MELSVNMKIRQLLQTELVSETETGERQTDT
jgi:hypothetical protein